MRFTLLNHNSLHICYSLVWVDHPDDIKIEVYIYYRETFAVVISIPYLKDK